MEKHSTFKQQNRTKQQDNTIAVEKITTSLHRGELDMATLLVAHHVKQRRPTNSADIAAATEESYSICARTYEEIYGDRESFEAMWAGVEDGLKRIFP